MLPPATIAALRPLTADPATESTLIAGLTLAVLILLAALAALLRSRRRTTTPPPADKSPGEDTTDHQAADTGPAPSRPVDWNLAAGIGPATGWDPTPTDPTPGTENDTAHTDATDPFTPDALDDLHTHLTGVPASAAELGTHPVTGDLHLRSSRPDVSDPAAAPVPRHAGTPPAHRGPAEDVAPRVPDLAPGANTTPTLPPTPETGHAAALDAALEARDPDVAAALAAHHPEIAHTALLAAASFAGSGPDAVRHLAAALDTDPDTDPAAAAALEHLTLAVPVRRHHAHVTVPVTHPNAALALAAGTGEDDTIDVIEAAHAHRPTPMTHLLRLDAALAGTWPPITATRRVDRNGAWPHASAHVPVDTYEHLRLGEHVPAARRSRTDGWLLLYSHARAVVGDRDAIEAFRSTLTRYLDDTHDEDPVRVNVDALHVDLIYLDAADRAAAGHTEAAAALLGGVADSVGTHPGLAALAEHLRVH